MKSIRTGCSWTYQNQCYWRVRRTQATRSTLLGLHDSCGDWYTAGAHLKLNWTIPFPTTTSHSVLVATYPRLRLDLEKHRLTFTSCRPIRWIECQWLRPVSTVLQAQVCATPQSSTEQHGWKWQIHRWGGKSSPLKYSWREKVTRSSALGVCLGLQVRSESNSPEINSRKS